MKVIADSHDAVLTNALSSVTIPLCDRSFAMLTAVSPSVPTTTGSSYSRSPWRRIAGGSLIGRLLGSPGRRGQAIRGATGLPPWPGAPPRRSRRSSLDVDRRAERQLLGQV